VKDELQTVAKSKNQASRSYLYSKNPRVLTVYLCWTSKYQSWVSFQWNTLTPTTLWPGSHHNILEFWHLLHLQQYLGRKREADLCLSQWMLKVIQH